MTCLVLIHRQLRAGLVASALITMATYVLLASPVTWSHHWAWAAPALMVLVERWRSTGAARFLVTAVAGLVIFVSRLIWPMPAEGGAERRWAWWQHILGNAQTLWGVALIAVLATAIPRSPAAAPETVVQAGSSVPLGG